MSGLGIEGGDLRFVFAGAGMKHMHVDRAERPAVVQWTVVECGFLPDWVGTRPCFELSRRETGGCALRFRHHGLTPQLECYTYCRPGWDQYLASLHDYVEYGRGRPFGSEAAGATD